MASFVMRKWLLTIIRSRAKIVLMSILVSSNPRRALIINEKYRKYPLFSHLSVALLEPFLLHFLL